MTLKPQKKETYKPPPPIGVDIGAVTDMAALDMEDITPITDTDTAGVGLAMAGMATDGHIIVTMDIGGERILTTDFIRYEANVNPQRIIFQRLYLKRDFRL